MDRYKRLQSLYDAWTYRKRIFDIRIAELNKECRSIAAKIEDIDEMLGSADLNVPHIYDWAAQHVILLSERRKNLESKIQALISQRRNIEFNQRRVEILKNAHGTKLEKLADEMQMAEILENLVNARTA